MDGRRQRYLEAMGIPVWVRRDAPAGTAPGPGTVAAEPAPAPVEPAPIAPASEPPPPKGPAAGGEGGRSPAVIEAMDWPELEAAVHDCPLCPELAANRTQTVFGVGNRQAEWMVVGEAPGADEDRQGEPFVGRAGKLLDNMLRAAGFAREQVFIANILKCRPPNNRDPRPEEAAHCAPYLNRQIALVAPRVILAVGRVAAQNLLETDQPLGRLRGRMHSFGPQRIPVVVTYHPAYLLRSPGAKRKTWEDLRRALQALGGD